MKIGGSRRVPSTAVLHYLARLAGPSHAEPLDRHDGTGPARPRSGAP